MKLGCFLPRLGTSPLPLPVSIKADLCMCVKNSSEYVLHCDATDDVPQELSVLHVVGFLCLLELICGCHPGAPQDYGQGTCVTCIPDDFADGIVH